MWTIKSLNKSNSVNINPFFMILPPFNSSQWDESNELNIIKNESVVIEIAIIYFLLNLGYLTTFWPLLFRPFRPYFDPISTWFFNFGFMYNVGAERWVCVISIFLAWHSGYTLKFLRTFSIWLLHLILPLKSK